MHVAKTTETGAANAGRLPNDRKLWALARPICVLRACHKHAILQCSPVLLSSPEPRLGTTPLTLGRWVNEKSLAYRECRAWLLSYAKAHADTSPLKNKLYLPSGKKQHYWALFYFDSKRRGCTKIPALSTFLKAWRVDLPFIVLRPPCGIFSSCGLCDFLKMMIQTARDNSVKEQLLLTLGSHFEFQGAQRTFLDNLFQESIRDPTQLLLIGWDKMDQSKTILPRVRALVNTPFHKQGDRLVTSLICVWSPALFNNRPLLYTIMEDFQHGSNMICSLLVDTLCDAAQILGCLPRRGCINADNTTKETKNTVVIFACVWILAHLEHTRLEGFDMVYLVVGHTHDIKDAIFSYINKALHGEDVLSLP